VLEGAAIRPPLLHAGHGDEPVEAQAFVAAARAVIDALLEVGRRRGGAAT
jgi:hypothetical protein